MTGADGGRPGSGQHGAVGFKSHLAVFAAPEPGDFYVGSHADAQLFNIAGVSATLLLRPQSGIVGSFKSGIKRSFVFATVVHRARFGGERESVGSDEVNASHFGGVHADFRSKKVDRSLNSGRGFGAAGPSVSTGRCGVGNQRFEFAFHPV